MNIARIANKIAGIRTYCLTMPLSDRADYGKSKASLPRGETANVETISDVIKTPGEDEWCVVSPNNPDWSGGCYPSKNRAEKRLDEVEMFKHMNK